MVSGKSFDALLDAGINRQVQNDLAGAIALYRDALAMRPDDAEALCLLGAAEHESGLGPDGLNRLRKAVDIEPEEPRFRIQLALALSRESQDGEAFPHLMAATARIPVSGDFARLLVETGLKAGVFPESAQLARRWLGAEPGNTLALRFLSEASFASGDYISARQALEDAAGAQPSADDSTALARINIRLNDPDRAATHAEHARALAPDSVPAMEVAAQIALYTGRADEATALAENALERDPDSVSALGTLLEVPGRKSDAVLGRARAVLESGQLTPAARIALGYGLGRALDANEEYASAFDVARDANQRQAELRAAAGVHVDRQQDVLALGTDVFDADFIARLQSQTGALSPDPRPIFVIGPPRSGTSLTEKLLSGTDEVAGLGERGAMMPAFMRVLELAQSSGITAAREFALNQAEGLARNEIASWAEIAGSASVVVDKTPAYLYAAGWLVSLFPRAKFVHLARDRRDVIVSSFFQNLPIEYAYANQPDLMPAALDQADRIAAAWQTRIPAWMSFSYDDFVGDPETQARSLFDFCELTWNEAVLDPNRPGGLTGFSAIAASGEITDRRRERWRNYAEAFGWD